MVEGAGHAQHGDVRDAGRDPPRAAAAVLRPRVRELGPTVRLVPRGDVHQQLGHPRRAALLRRHAHDSRCRRHAICANFAFETGFTNLQFIGLSWDAAKAGDFTFSKLIQSIQSDEARHAQLGTPLLQMLIENGQKEKAQKLDRHRLLAVLAAVHHADRHARWTTTSRSNVREASFKEFMEEWIVTQFIRSLENLGLSKPWYWDIFLRDVSRAPSRPAARHLVVAADAVVEPGGRRRPRRA